MKERKSKLEEDAPTLVNLNYARTNVNSGMKQAPKISPPKNAKDSQKERFRIKVGKSTKKTE